MRLTTLFLMIALFQIHANPSYGQNSKVNLNLQNVSLENVLNKIEVQTDYKFVYKDTDVDFKKQVTVNASNKRLSDVFDDLFSEIDITYEISGNLIVLKPKPKSQLNVLQEEGTLDIDQLQLSGTVLDENGSPLPGASIVEKGTTNGVTTDFDGNFIIEVSQSDAVLVVSYIGFATQEVELAGKTKVSIILQESAAGLEEVVVIGYGTQEVKDLTGAVAVVSSESIENRQTTQVSDALQGSIAGVTVTRSGGRPGASSQVRVRGITSLNVNNPLVIVDGVQGLSLDDVNPNDVESISVLKDAASQAIYGARAASGVILVTTKRGRAGRFSIDYDYELGISSPTTLPDFVDAKTYRTLANEYATNDGGGETFDPQVTAQYEQLHAQDPDAYPDTNWQKAIFNNNAPIRHRHNLAFALGSEKISSRASMSYVTEEGLYPNNEFERYTFRLNNSLNFSEAFKVNIDFNYRRVNSLAPGQSNITGNNAIVALAYRYPDIYSALRTDGEFAKVRMVKTLWRK